MKSRLHEGLTSLHSNLHSAWTRTEPLHNSPAFIYLCFTSGHNLNAKPRESPGEAASSPRSHRRTQPHIQIAPTVLRVVSPRCSALVTAGRIGNTRRAVKNEKIRFEWKRSAGKLDGLGSGEATTTTGLRSESGLVLLGARPARMTHSHTHKPRLPRPSLRRDGVEEQEQEEAVGWDCAITHW